MSRWFRHYAGMMRDDKLVRVAIKSKQTVERVVWIYGAILESAAEIDDNGRYDLDAAEIAYFLRADDHAVADVLSALEYLGCVREGVVVRWNDRQQNHRPPAHEWRVIRDRVFARDDYTCGYCEARGVALECDHIVPVARGGGHDDSNLITACKACNRSKRDMLVAEWRS